MVEEGKGDVEPRATRGHEIRRPFALILDVGVNREGPDPERRCDNERARRELPERSAAVFAVGVWGYRWRGGLRVDRSAKALQAQTKSDQSGRYAACSTETR